MAGKITDYTPMTTLTDGDLLDISDFDEVSAYVSKSITWALLKTNVESQITFTNLYTADGILSGNRTVDLVANELTFESTIDANLLKLETTFGRIGIGTATPAEKLEVVGNSLFTLGSDGHVTIGDGTGSGASTLAVKSRFASNASPLASFYDIAGVKVFEQLGNGSTTIGRIGSSAVTHSILGKSNADMVRFSVDTAAQDFADIGNDAAGIGYFKLSRTNAVETPKVLIHANLNVDSYIDAGNFGIGTQTPTEKLEIVGNIYANTGAVGIGVAPSTTRRLNVKSDASDTSIAWFRTSGGDEVLDLKENRTILMIGNTGSRFAMGTTSSGASVVRVKGDVAQTDVFSVIDSSSADILVLSEDKTVKLESAATSVFGFGGVSTPSTIARFGASTTAKSSMRIIHGTAPTTPADGDLWTTTAGLFVRINGSTIGPLS